MESLNKINSKRYSFYRFVAQVVCLFSALILPQVSQAERLKDLAGIQGVRQNQLMVGFLGEEGRI